MKEATTTLTRAAGHKRYSHFTVIRSDGVNPSLLEMNKVISEDFMPNALKRIPVPLARKNWLTMTRKEKSSHRN
jgi:hypothetical protein